MGTQVVANALVACNKGTVPCPLKATVAATVSAGGPGMVAATVMDYAAANIMTFGMCTTSTNPQVSAATAAAQGVLTPMPCSPKILSPWSPGSADVKIANQAALNDSSKCKCMWTGEISVSFEGQATVSIS